MRQCHFSQVCGIAGDIWVDVTWVEGVEVAMEWLVWVCGWRRGESCEFGVPYTEVGVPDETCEAGVSGWVCRGVAGFTWCGIGWKSIGGIWSTDW